MIKLGEKIRSLRKRRDISQEVLADYLGVTFQAVSKWETGAAMPDVVMIPAIASFFGVSTDELFDYDRLENEKKVDDLCREAMKYILSDRAKAEETLREGLRRFPGSDVILVCLLYVIDVPERADEVVSLCQSMLESVSSISVKYDVLRILAGAYKTLGDYSRVKDTIEKIPEFYFSKLGVAAELLEGEDRFNAAMEHRSYAFRDLLKMYGILADHYAALGEKDKAKLQLETALNIYKATKQDFSAGGSRGLYEAFSDEAVKMEQKLGSL